MNGTKALLSLTLAVIALLAYDKCQSITFEAIVYGRNNYEAYGVFYTLMFVTAISAIVALALSLNFVERYLTEEKPKEEPFEAANFDDTW